MKASEAKQESLQKIRFEAKATFNEKPAKLKNKQLYLRLNELVMSKVTPLFSQESTAIFNEQQQVFFFPRFEFTSDISRSSLPVPQKTFLIEIFEVDPKNKQKKKCGGSDGWVWGVRPPDIKFKRSAGEGMRGRAKYNEIK